MLAPNPSDGLWASAAAEWATVAGFIVSIAATIFVWGKNTQRTKSAEETFTRELGNHKESVKQQLDGFGGRVANMESEHDHINGRLDEASGHVQRLLGQHDSILGLLGEAKGSSVQCREDTIALGEKLERKLDGMSIKISSVELNLSQRLASVETKLDYMGKDKS